MKSISRIICLFIAQIVVSQANSARAPRAPPRVETRPNLSDSYVPALMQIIAHDTELMKYQIKPQQEATTAKPQTTTTKRSTPSHLPGILQPVPPPKPSQIVPQGFPQNTKVTVLPISQQAPGLSYSYYPVVPGVVGFIPFNGLVLNRGYSTPVDQPLLGVQDYNLDQNGQFFGQTGQYLGQNGQFLGQNKHFLGQNGQFMGQNGQFLGQNQQYLGQNGQFLSQNGQYLGQNKQLLGQNGHYIGQNGAYFGHLARSLTELDTGNRPSKTLKTRSLRELEQEQISQIAKSLKVSEEDQVDRNVEKYLGKGFSDVFKLANKIDNEYDEETKFLQFSKNFDDVDFGLELLKQLRQKRIPPTKAYVTLLNLYDELNKELKRLGFNKFTGYNQAVLRDLVESSKQNSAYQLRFVLQKIVDNQDIKNPTIVPKLKKLLQDFDEENGYIYKALIDISPMPFSE